MQRQAKPSEVVAAAGGSPIAAARLFDLLGPAALVLAHLPLLFRYGRQLWNLPHYQFFVYMPFAAGALLWTRREQFVVRRPPPGVVWLALILFGFATLGVATALNSPWLGMLSFLVAWTGGAYALGGAFWLRAISPAIVLTLLLVRPPLNLDVTLINGMQTVTARWASKALDAFDVVHVLQGNVVALPNRRLLVEEACSGIQSLFSTLACVLFLVLWQRRSMLLGIVLLFSAPLWVLLANAARVTVVTVLIARWGIDADKGYIHDALGVLGFAAVLLLVWSAANLFSIGAFFVRTAAPAEPEEDLDPETPAAPWSDRPPPRAATVDRRTPIWATLTLTLGGVALFGVQLRALFSTRSAATELVDPKPIHLGEVAPELMPAQWHIWKRAGFRTSKIDQFDVARVVSHVWTYRGGGGTMQISADYPFYGWHELPNCYRAQGWTLAGRQVDEQPGVDDQAGFSFVEMEMERPELGRAGRLYFALMDVRGRYLAPGAGSDELATRMTTRLSFTENPLLQWLSGPSAGSFIQVQMLVETPIGLAEREKEQSRALFAQACRRLAGLQASEGAPK